MDLLPFDLEAFKAGPMRVRRFGSSSARPLRAAEALGMAVVVWNDIPGPVAYEERDQRLVLRLTPKTRTIKVRLYRACEGTVYAWTNDGINGCLIEHPDRSWIGEAFEREIPCE